VDIFDHMTSLARASHSSHSVVLKNWWGHFISVSRRLRVARRQHLHFDAPLTALL